MHVSLFFLLFFLISRTSQIRESILDTGTNRTCPTICWMLHFLIADIRILLQEPLLLVWRMPRKIAAENHYMHHFIAELFSNLVPMLTRRINFLPERNCLVSHTLLEYIFNKINAIDRISAWRTIIDESLRDVQKQISSCCSTLLHNLSRGAWEINICYILDYVGTNNVIRCKQGYLQTAKKFMQKRALEASIVVYFIKHDEKYT